MKKLINRFLKLVGLNLVRAKRRNVKAGYRSHVQIEDANTGPRPLSDYMGQSEWQDTPPFAAPVPNPGKTHYVGDGCPGGHSPIGADDHKMTRVEQPNSDNKISGPTS